MYVVVLLSLLVTDEVSETRMMMMMYEASNLSPGCWKGCDVAREDDHQS